jgi:large conductance mechanosensitive channel
VLQEFKDFINKGNFVDIAVAFVIGAAFGQVVTAFTGRVVSPLIAMIFDVGDLDGVLTFGAIDEATGLPAGSIGAFLAAAINFVIVGFVMFMVVRAYNSFRARNAEPEPEPEPEAEAEEIIILRDIRDALSRQ